jgi:hypothetical protein
VADGLITRPLSVLLDTLRERSKINSFQIIR